MTADYNFRHLHGVVDLTQAPSCSFFIVSICFAGLSPLGQACVQFLMVWQRYSLNSSLMESRRSFVNSSRLSWIHLEGRMCLRHTPKKHVISLRLYRRKPNPKGWRHLKHLQICEMRCLYKWQTTKTSDSVSSFFWLRGVAIISQKIFKFSCALYQIMF